MACSVPVACNLLHIIVQGLSRTNYYAFRRWATMPDKLPVTGCDEAHMKRLYASTRAALAMASMLAVVPAAQAQSVADFYRGKTITYNLAVPDGASWGLYARTFIEHLRKHIPGEPLVILQVMPGGGGVAAGNHIFNVALKDGTVIGTPLSTAMVFAATDQIGRA